MTEAGPALVHLDDLAVPRFSPDIDQICDLMATMASECPLDADVLHAKAAAETGLSDFGPDDYRERLEVYLDRTARNRRLAWRRDRQFPRAGIAIAQEPAAAQRPAGAPSRDPRNRTAAAGRHRRPAAHRHYPSAQLAGGGPDVSHHPVLGERRAVPAAGGDRNRARSAQGPHGRRGRIHERGDAALPADARDDHRARP